MCDEPNEESLEEEYSMLELADLAIHARAAAKVLKKREAEENCKKICLRVKSGYRFGVESHELERLEVYPIDSKSCKVKVINSIGNEVADRYLRLGDELVTTVTIS
jgi:hypothetical protein